MKKDLIISIVSHLLLIAIIGVINPISAMFRPPVEIIIVKTYEMEGGGPSGRQSKAEPTTIAPPKSGKEAPKEEADDAANIKPVKKDAKAVEKPKDKKKKDRETEKKREESKEQADESKSDDNTPKEDATGGIEVNEKVGGTGSGVGKGSGKGNLPYNIGMVLSVIERNWRNVVTDANPITCTVFFQIDRYGYVVGDPIIEKSSGITPFDQSCLLAIKRAGQFPAFPPNFNYSHLGLHLDFVYEPGT